MVDRWIVSEESKELGILGYVRTLTRSARRVYSRNMLIGVLMGKLSCEYESRNYDMNKGDLIFISEGSSFSYAPENCTVLYFSIPTACFPELSGKISLASAGSASDLPYRPIHRLLGEILRAQYEGGTHYSLKLQSVWKEMIYLLLTGFLTSSGSMTGFQKETASRTRHDHDFVEILSILGRSYMEPLQLNELAEMFYYTPSHLSRLFHI